MDEIIKQYLESNTECELVRVLDRPTGFELELVYRGKLIHPPILDLSKDMPKADLEKHLDLYIHLIKLDYFDYIDELYDNIEGYQYHN
jgi:hypothetical protein